jgi:hypothetical protein
MQYAVKDLEGALLDAAVAKAEGYELDSDGDNMTVRENGGAPSRWRPSTDWEQGGQIIEREGISLTSPDMMPRPGLEWGAEVLGTLIERSRGGRDRARAAGAAPLIAAMRAF